MRGEWRVSRRTKSKANVTSERFSFVRRCGRGDAGPASPPGENVRVGLPPELEETAGIASELCGVYRMEGPSEALRMIGFQTIAFEGAAARLREDPVPWVHRAMLKLLALTLGISLSVGCVGRVFGVGNGEIPARAPGAPYPNWEYICVTVDRTNASSVLNRAGEHGWELVSGDANGLFCFKRPVFAAPSAPTITAQQ